MAGAVGAAAAKTQPEELELKRLTGIVTSVIYSGPNSDLVVFKTCKPLPVPNKRVRRLVEEGKLRDGLDADEVEAENEGDKCTDEDETELLEDDEDGVLSDDSFIAKEGESQQMSDYNSDEDYEEEDDGNSDSETDSNSSSGSGSESNDDDDDESMETTNNTKRRSLRQQQQKKSVVVEEDDWDWDDEEIQGSNGNKKSNKRTHEEAWKSESLELWGRFPSHSPMFQYTIEVHGNRVQRIIWPLVRKFTYPTRTQFEKYLTDLNFVDPKQLEIALAPWQKPRVMPKAKQVTEDALQLLAKTRTGQQIGDNILLSDAKLMLISMCGRAAYRRTFASQIMQSWLTHFLIDRPDMMPFLSELRPDLHRCLSHRFTASETIQLMHETVWPEKVPNEKNYTLAVEMFDQCRRDRQLYKKTLTRVEQKDKLTNEHMVAMDYLRTQVGMRIVEAGQMVCSVLPTVANIEWRLYKCMRSIMKGSFPAVRDVVPSNHEEYGPVLEAIKIHPFVIVTIPGSCPRLVMKWLHEVLPQGTTMFVFGDTCKHNEIPVARSIENVLMNEWYDNEGTGPDVESVTTLVVTEMESVDSTTLAALLLQVFKHVQQVILIGDETAPLPWSAPDGTKYGTPLHALCTSKMVPRVRIDTKKADDLAGERLLELWRCPLVPHIHACCKMCTVGTTDDEVEQAATMIVNSNAESPSVICVCTHASEFNMMRDAIKQKRIKLKQNNIFTSGCFVFVGPDRQFGRLKGLHHSTVVNRSGKFRVQFPLRTPDRRYPGPDRSAVTVFVDDMKSMCDTTSKSSNSHSSTKIVVDPPNAQYPFVHADCVYVNELDAHTQRFDEIYFCVNSATNVRDFNAVARMCKGMLHVMSSSHTNLDVLLNSRLSLTNSYLRHLLITQPSIDDDQDEEYAGDNENEVCE
jgi:hypothetical protein